MESPLNSAKGHRGDNDAEMKQQQKPGVAPNFEEQN
jgi:hypothetical protein